jgi:hypothetical protein
VQYTILILDFFYPARRKNAWAIGRGTQQGVFFCRILENRTKALVRFIKKENHKLKLWQLNQFEKMVAKNI